MRTVLLAAVALGLAAATAVPASAETCLYLTKPGAPKKIACVPVDPF
jgi:hypothetical protein